RGGGADTRTGEIEGVITDAEHGELLAGVTIVVLHGGEVAATQITDVHGYFRARHLAPDTYVVAIYYADLTISVSHVVIEPGRMSTVDWKIDPRAANGDVIRGTWQPAGGHPHHAPVVSSSTGAVIGVITTKSEQAPARDLKLVAKGVSTLT